MRHGLDRRHGVRRCFTTACVALVSTAFVGAALMISSAPAGAAAGLGAGFGFAEGSGTTTQDQSGNGFTATVTGATWTTAGRFGSALQFGGTANARTAANLSLGSAFTMMAWVNNPANAAYETVMTVGTDRDLVLKNGAATFYNGSAELSLSGKVPTGSWQHLAVVSTGSRLQAYLNGTALGTGRNATLAATSGRLAVGAWMNGSSVDDAFSGTIDEVRVYNRALTVAEIQADLNTPMVPAVDTLPPTISNPQPSGVLPTGTTQTNLQVTTNESATCRYGTTPGVAYASMANTFTTTGGTSHATTVAGLQDGTSYSYFVRCQDPAGNATTGDASVAFSVAAPDATPPSVSVTAPANGATVAGSVTVTAAASDNVGVAGVQLLVDGANLGSEDTTSPYSATWTTTAVANGTHAITARARDLAGNQTTSAVVTVTVYNPPASGPRVAYALNEGAGTAVGDSSGNGATATATSPTWTTSGRHGGALTFNGSSSRVRSNANVTLPAAFTMEAWVLDPSTAGYQALATVGSDRDLYVVNGVLTFWTGAVDLSFGTVPAGSWNHVAVTSDGTSVRAYLNGSPLGSPATAALGAITAPLQLGAWINGSSNSDFLSGTLDEVRVYGRALSAAEIQADMATPIASGGPDTSPPVLSGGSPAGVLPASTTEASLQVTTSEAANCRYGSAPGVAYSGQPSTFTTTGGQAHASLVTGLTPGTTSTFYVRCQDLAGNATTSDYTISFSVAGGLNISSLQFFGNGTGQIDRVEVPLTAGSSINVGGDFTIEWWMRTDAGNGSGACATANNDWIYGNILIDRDVFGAGDNGDYGVSLFGATGQIAFGVSRGNSGTTLCSSVGVADGAWHHVAVTRRGDNGLMAIFVDGVARGSTTGPSGDVSYRQGHVGAENDPVLVFGAEKHDAGAEFPSYHGRLDEIRISSAIRYAGPFAVPTTALAADGATVALYHFDEGAGTVAHDATGNDDGAVLFGGNPVGPVWSSTVPF